MNEAWHYVDGEWTQGNPKLLGPLSHGMWMASVVFDGARQYQGGTPDLDLHCARVIESGRTLGLKPPVAAGEVEAVAREGIARFPRETELYIRPVLYAEEGFVAPDPESTRFILTVFPAPVPQDPISACLTEFRRPSPETAPTTAKASCLYPNVARALTEARHRGFHTAVMLDPLGNVAEFASSNLFIATGGVVATPALNGCFLPGITRHRVIALLREAGVTVEERRVTWDDLKHADEIFSTGNWGKIQPLVLLEDRPLQPGPMMAQARELYIDYARRC